MMLLVVMDDLLYAITMMLSIVSKSICLTFHRIPDAFIENHSESRGYCCSTMYSETHKEL